MTYAVGLRGVQGELGRWRVAVVRHPIGRGAFGRQGEWKGWWRGERLKRAQSERELNTRLALLAGLECRVRLDAARTLTDRGGLRGGGGGGARGGELVS